VAGCGTGQLGSRRPSSADAIDELAEVEREPELPPCRYGRPVEQRLDASPEAQLEYRVVGRATEHVSIALAHGGRQAEHVGDAVHDGIPWRRIRDHRARRAAAGQGVLETRVDGVECDPAAAVARVVRFRGHMPQHVVELGLGSGDHDRGIVHRRCGEQHGHLDADRLATAQMGVLVMG
jgi:hypothetical protein